MIDSRETVPMTRLDNHDPELMNELLATVERVARAGGFTLGPELEAFEAEYASYVGSSHAVGVSSGTDALTLVLRALGVGPNDEVVVPANSFIATAEAVSMTGATPRFADVDPTTAVVTAETVSAAITERTRCIIPVHLYGRTVELDPILQLADAAGVPVVEDAAQAHGARIKDSRAGTFGVAGCFSFYPAKNLGGWGDGGAVVSNNADLADRVRLLRSHGERNRYHHEVVGTTNRLDALQAAILRVKLRRLDAWNVSRRRVAAALTEALRGGPVRVPAPAEPNGDHVFHQFVVECDDRDHLRATLAERGVMSAIHYPVPIHLTPAYEFTGLSAGDLPSVERLASRVCSLPIWPTMTDSEISRVADAVMSAG